LHADAKLRRFTPHEEIDRKTRRRLLVLEEDYRFTMAGEAAARVIRRGGSAVVGGHGEQQGLATHWELWMFAMSGLSPLEALRAATLGGAEAIGFASDLGSIEAGKLADLVVLNRNPLENIRATTDIRYVMKNGVLLDGETLDQLWPEKRSFPAFYWHRQDEELRRRRPPSPTP
jgi:imidazolonepropionase-like amidohydrolase